MLIVKSVTLAIVVVEEIECPFELEGDASETESEGPTATSNCVTSNISTSPGCVRAYDSDKDGEGGVVFKDVYLEFVVLVAVKFGNDAEIVGAKVGSCKELDDSFSLDAEQDSIS